MEIIKMENLQIGEQKENNNMNFSHESSTIDSRVGRYENLFGFSAEDLKKKSVLDIGAGSGDFIRMLREQYGNTKSFAVDLDQTKIPEDRPEWYLISDGLNLPFANETFDVVIAKHYLMLFYLNDNQDALVELLRVLSRGGTLYFDAQDFDQFDKNIKKKEMMNGGKVDDNWKTRNALKSVGAIKYEMFLDNLSGDEYIVSKEDKGRSNVWKITKK